MSDIEPTNDRAPAGIRDLRNATSFAAYFAKYLIAKKGYREGTVPEAEPLAAASDYILTKLDGLSLSIICIVDASRDLKRTFALDRDTVLKAASRCRTKYSGRATVAKMPVLVEIIEFRNRVTPEDLARLRPLRSRVRQIVSAFAVDLGARKVHRNFWVLHDMRGRMIERALNAPRLTQADLAPPPPRAEPDVTRKPVLTVAMLALLVVVFALEVKFPADGIVSTDPSIATLIAFGGLIRDLVIGQGEWYRLFTAPLLHGNLEHILFNGIALWFAGTALERLLGRVWLFALFFVGALGGALMSLAINSPGIVSVGASGAIMCLIAAAFVTSFRAARGSRTGTQFLMLRMLIPSLIPLASHGGGQVDYGAHFGGALTGFAFGAIILAAWPLTEAAPRLAPLAKALGVLGFLVFAGAGYQAYAGYGDGALGARLIPDSQLPQNEADYAKRAKDFVRDYPDDPRAHYIRAVAVMQADPVTAEHELRTALSKRRALTVFSHDFEVTLAATLGEVLIQEGRVDEARLAAKPYCHDGPNGGVPKDMAELKLCAAQ
jgi:rhomboid protease GluP